MRYERVKVKRDTNTVHNHAVAPWEIPVLEFLFEAGNIEPLDEFVAIEGEYPDATAELDRLAKVYGADAKSGIPHAFSVFGSGRKGVRELQKLIDDAKANDESAQTKATPIPAAPKKRGRRPAYENESLLS